MSSSKVLKMTTRIGTHDGTFHCDEALGCFMLKRTKVHAPLALQRARKRAHAPAFHVLLLSPHLD
jgi:uncharacterized UPF0160 family protein